MTYQLRERVNLLLEDDEAILQKLFVILTARVTADPYAWDGSYAKQIRQLPTGLRAMAATHDLVVSFSRGDFGWHFLQCGEPNHVQETEAGLRELGLGELAGLFHEAYQIILPHLSQLRVSGNYLECMEREGHLSRIQDLTRAVTEMDERCGEPLSGSAIYASWIRYARAHPGSVFGS